MKRMGTLWRIALSLAVLLLALAPRPSHAYDPDTHYQITYTLCRAVGFSHADALVVAQCDQGMDDSNGTLANIGARPQITEEKLWHALPDTADPRVVIARKNAMFTTATQMPDRLRKLQYLGVFFHYQQDTWAHRVHPNSDPTRFTPYTQPLGHGLMGHQPDRPPFDPICALRCLEEGINYARTALRNLGGTPTPLFDNYSAAQGVVDDTWSGKGKFINQITIDRSTRAREFSTTLIRAQIDCYTNGPEVGNPNYIGYYTSNEAEYGKIRSALTSTCARFGISLNIPEVFVPLSTLTTDMILAGNVLPSPGATPAQIVVRIQSAANGKYITASDGLEDNQWLYCKDGSPVSFVVVGPRDNCVLKVSGRDLYLSYNATTGAVKLWRTPDAASFSLERQGNGNYAIKSLSNNQYVWLSGESPYITRSGNPSTAAGQWRIDLPSPVVPAPPQPSAPGRVQEGKYYQIRAQSPNNSYYLGVVTGSLDSGASAYFAALFPGADDQFWKFTKIGDYYQIINKKSGKALNVSSASTEENASIIQWDVVGAENEQWKIEQRGNAYVLIARHSRKSLSYNGTRAFQASQGTNAIVLIPADGGPTLPIVGPQPIPPPIPDPQPIPPAPVPVVKTIKIKSVANGQYLCASDGLADNQWLYCRPGTPVEFVVVGSQSNGVLKVKDKELYLSYNATTGAVKLWSNPSNASFSFERQGNGTYGIKSLYYSQYIWLSSESPYITKSGNPGTASGQWYIEGL